MKATLLLRKDHERVHELFEKLRHAKASVQNGRRAAFEELRRELSFHSNVETTLFYPELGAGSNRAVELVDAAMEEHRKIDSLLEEIALAGSNDKNFDAKILHLMEEVNKHVNEEEEEIFPEARRLLSEQRLEELGLEMEDRKKILGQAAA